MEGDFHTFNMSAYKYNKRFLIWTRIFWKKSNFRILSLQNFIKCHVFLVFDPFAPTCANFHLAGVIKHAEINFWAYSKCLQQGAIKSSYFGSSAGIWTLDSHETEKKKKKDLDAKATELWQLLNILFKEFSIFLILLKSMYLLLQKGQKSENVTLPMKM